MGWEEGENEWQWVIGLDVSSNAFFVFVFFISLSSEHMTPFTPLTNTAKDHWCSAVRLLLFRFAVSANIASLELSICHALRTGIRYQPWLLVIILSERELWFWNPAWFFTLRGFLRRNREWKLFRSFSVLWTSYCVILRRTTDPPHIHPCAGL